MPRTPFSCLVINHFSTEVAAGTGSATTPQLLSLQSGRCAWRASACRSAGELPGQQVRIREIRARRRQTCHSAFRWSSHEQTTSPHQQSAIPSSDSIVLESWGNGPTVTHLSRSEMFLCSENSIPTVAEQGTYGRKRRGSVTRDRCCRLALDPVPVFRSTAPLTTAIWDWKVCYGGQGSPHSPRPME